MGGIRQGRHRAWRRDGKEQAQARPAGRPRTRIATRAAVAVASSILAAGAPGPSASAAGASGPSGASLRVVGHTSLDGAGSFADVAVHRRAAYVGTRDEASCPPRGVKVVDLTDPRRPNPIGTVAAYPLTLTEDVAVTPLATPSFRGDLLAVSLQACDEVLDDPVGKSGVEFVDVSDPRRPVVLSRLDLGVPHLAGVHELTVFQRGAHAYALLAVPFSELVTGVFTPQRVRGDVWIADITDPRAPRVLSDWAAGRDAGLAFGAPFVRPVFGLGAPFDCTPPPGAGPLCRGEDFPAVFGHSVSANPDGTRAYVSYWDAGMVVLDITDPTRPRLLGRGGPRLDEEGNTHSAVPARGDRLAVTTDEDQFPGPWGFTRIWDVVDPTRPVEVGRFATANALSARSDGDYSVHKPVVRGNRLYLSHYSDGLRVVDISRPASPRELAAFVPPVPAPRVDSVDVGNGLVLITESRAGLFVLRDGRSAPG